MNRLKIPIWTLAGGLIILQMVLVAIIVHGESLTFDEGDHIFAGYMMWHSGDYGLNPEHPPLVKLVSTLPLLPPISIVSTRPSRLREESMSFLPTPALLNLLHSTKSLRSILTSSLTPTSRERFHGAESLGSMNDAGSIILNGSVASVKRHTSLRRLRRDEGRPPLIRPNLDLGSQGPPYSFKRCQPRPYRYTNRGWAT